MTIMSTVINYIYSTRWIFFINDPRLTGIRMPHFIGFLTINQFFTRICNLTDGETTTITIHVLYKDIFPFTCSLFTQISTIIFIFNIFLSFFEVCKVQKCKTQLTKMVKLLVKSSIPVNFLQHYFPSSNSVWFLPLKWICIFWITKWIIYFFYLYPQW